MYIIYLLVFLAHVYSLVLYDRCLEKADLISVLFITWVQSSFDIQIYLL